MAQIALINELLWVCYYRCAYYFVYCWLGINYL